MGPEHKHTEWRQGLNKLENLILSCYAHVPETSTVPATSSTDEASTSGLTRADVAAAAATSSTTTTTTTTTSTGNHSDEVSTSFVNDDEFNTLNAEHLDCEFVDTDESDPSLPDISEAQELTTFRALNECEKTSFKKYSHVDTSLDSDLD